MKALVMGVGLTLVLAGTAFADTCSVSGVTKTCDLVCGTGTCQPASFVDCDQVTGNSDGTCTICGSGSLANTIIGTDHDDQICGKGGDDTITGGDGADRIDGGDGADIIDGGNGDDFIRGQGDADIIDGGAGRDTIAGDAGDDDIDGGADNDTVSGDGGNDTVDGGGGANLVYGGSGNDTLRNTQDASVPVLGSVLCGGGGNDTLIGEGYGHICMDAGSSQSTPGDCSYTASGAGVHDVATQLNCNTTTGSFLAVARSCGCS